jgi:tetratricopeptide (TPR) repeat protein
MAIPPADEAKSANTAAPEPRVRLLSLAGLKQPKVLIALFVVLFTIVVVGAILFRVSAPAAAPVTGDDLVAALSAGDDIRAEKLAEQLQARNPTALSERIALRYVLGITQSRRADRMSGAASVKLHRQAAENLARAAEFGFPQVDAGEGLLRLGRSLLFSGQAEASREPLLAALEERAGDPLEIHRLLAEAYLREPRPQHKQALAHIDVFLASGRLSSEARRGGELLRAEIVIQSADTTEREQALAPLLSDAATRPRAMILQARVHIEDGRRLREQGHLTNRPEHEVEASNTFQKAIELLRKVQAEAPRDYEINASAMYLIGVVYLELNDPRAALDQFERASKRYIDSPEGWASLVEIGTLRLRMNSDADAVAAFAEALRLSRQMAFGNNRWISQEMLRDRLLEAIERLVERGAFSAAIELAKQGNPPLSATASLELEAKAHQSWGRQLLAQGQHSGATNAQQRAQEGRQRLRTAAKLFDTLARQRFATRFYPEDCWNTAQCYFEAQNYPLATRHLREYLDRAARSDRPQALVALGKTYLATGQYEDAIAVLRECVQFHVRHPAQFEARIVMSHAYLEQGDFPAAEKSLLENLSGDLLTPASKEWRESLFALGRLMHDTGRYSQAIDQLQAALKRYPEDHQALSARYLLADSHLQLANRFDAKARAEAVEETRRLFAAQRQRNFEEAAANYRTVAERLAELSIAGQLSPEQRAMWSASRFNRGASLAALERYEEAIEVYTQAVGADQSAPEALAGYVQIAECSRRLGQPKDAQTALALAGVALGRMPADARFAERSGLPRELWSNYLSWLRTL